MNFEELLNGITSGQLNNQMFIDIGLIVLVIAIVLIIISVIIVVIVNRQSKEEKIALKLIKSVNLMREGKFKPKVVKKNEFLSKNKEKPQIKKSELTLKEMLIKKFKPLIEKQLHSTVEFIDFNAGKDQFVAKINVQGHMLELILDSSGKILDYKNLDKP